MKIELTTTQIFLSSQIGLMRRMRAIKKGGAAAHGLQAGEFDWQYDVEGAMGECAVAVYLNQFWDGGTFKNRADGDVAGIEVRTTSKPSNRLILYPSDPDDSRFISVVGSNGTYTLRGWLLARDGKRDEYWQSPAGRPAYFVDNAALKPMSSFRMDE